jgi:hypothetical protein
MRAEDDLLYGPNPFLGACCAVGFELVGPFIRGDCKGDFLFALLLALKGFGRDGILQVDAVSWKVKLCRIGVV